LHLCKLSSRCDTGSVSQLNSLRERKRAECWAALHDAAAEAALEGGIEGVTVDGVANAAGVSPRTFFNYFPCKEDAVLGLREPVLDDAMLAEFDVHANLLDEVAKLMLAVTRSIQGGDDAIRHRILHKYPHLLHRRVQYVVKVEQLVTKAVSELLAGSDRLADAERTLAAHPVGGQYTPEDAVRMLVMTAGTALRFAMQKTMSQPTLESQTEALEHSLALLRAVLKESE
jgi:AcrR family transcriptional regulator